METYDAAGGDLETAIKCAHCGECYTHPTEANWLSPLKAIDVKDTVFGVPCGYLGCESCRGITGVWLMFHKGCTWLHTKKMESR
jgi:hypothetical protein